MLFLKQHLIFSDKDCTLWQLYCFLLIYERKMYCLKHICILCGNMSGTRARVCVRERELIIGGSIHVKRIKHSEHSVKPVLFQKIT
jgi:hypothetical protein